MRVSVRPSVREPLPSCQWLQPLDVYLRCLPEADQDPFAGEAREQGGAEAEGGVTHHTLFFVCPYCAQQRT